MFLQVIDPDALAGRDAYVAQINFLAAQWRGSSPIDAAVPVRLPGDQAATHIAKTRSHGVALSSKTSEALRTWADRLGVDATIVTSRT